MSVDGDLWYVKLEDGDVERVTLDQLDEAFQGGRIDENNMVMAAGSDRWIRLADLLGQADATPPPPPLTPQPQTAAQAQWTAPGPVVAMRPPAMVGQSFPASMPPLPLPAGMPPFPGTRSVRPVTFDLNSHVELGDVGYPKSSRKRWVVGALGTAAVLGVSAFIVVGRMAGSASADTTTPSFAAAAAVQPPPVNPDPPATPTPPTPPQTAMAGPSPVMDPTQRLTDTQKEKLAEADKKMKSHQKGHGAGGGGGGGGAVSSSHPSKKSAAVFTTGGSKYDPLNSSL